MSTKKSRYMRRREGESAAAARNAPDGPVTKCHEDFAYAYGVVANIIEGEEPTQAVA